jgi:hypothetical protein
MSIIPLNNVKNITKNECVAEKMASAELSAKGEAAPRAKPTAAFRHAAPATFRLSLKIVLDASGDLSSWHIRSSIPPDRRPLWIPKKGRDRLNRKNHRRGNSQNATLVRIALQTKTL